MKKTTTTKRTPKTAAAQPLPPDLLGALALITGEADRETCIVTALQHADRIVADVRSGGNQVVDGEAGAEDYCYNHVADLEVDDDGLLDSTRWSFYLGLALGYLTDTERTLDSPLEKTMLALQTMADEMEREKARQRAYDAGLRRARSGHVTGGRCFGYDNVPVTDAAGRRSNVDRRINESEARIVRRIFELSAEGHGMKAIAKRLNLEGAPSPRAQQGRSQTWGAELRSGSALPGGVPRRLHLEPDAEAGSLGRRASESPAGERSDRDAAAGPPDRRR